MFFSGVLVPALLALQAFASPTDRRSETSITETELTGGPHGSPVTNAVRVSHIMITNHL